MVRKKKKGFLKSQNKAYSNNMVYVCNLSVPQIFELFDSADFILAKRIFEDFVICFLGLFMMTQISISAKPENAEWTEKLPSYKDIKARIINGRTGSIVSACVGITLAYPYAREELEEMEGDNQYNSLVVIVEEMISSHTSNTKRIKPNKNEWLLYARGEMGAAKGQLLSCPSTNINKLNIDGSDVMGFGLDEALFNIGLDKSLYKKYEFDLEQIKYKIRKIFLVDKGGLPIEGLVYDEPSNIRSKIQEQILGDCLVRTEKIGTKLIKGTEPSSPINRNILTKNLTKSELFAYDISIRSGDTQMARKLTNTAITRSKQSSENNPI